MLILMNLQIAELLLFVIGIADSYKSIVDRVGIFVLLKNGVADLTT